MDDVLTSAVGAGVGQTVVSNVNSILNLAISRVVGALMGDDKESRKKELDAYYDRIAAIVDQSEVKKKDPMAGLSPRERIFRELDTVDNLVATSIESLEKARDLSRCGVCRSTLDDTLKLVKERAIPVVDATSKVRIMQRLKDEGAIAPDMLWEDLPKDKRKIVENMAAGITQSKIIHLRGVDASEVKEPEAKAPRATGSRKGSKGTKRSTKRSTKRGSRKKGN